MKHELAGTVEHLIGSFMRIKTLSASQEVDKLCLDGINVLYRMADVADIQKELDEVKARRIDPTM